MIAFRPRALIAEEEPAIRFALHGTLEELGFEVVDVADGESALEALGSDEHALAFLDIRLPDLSGLEVLERTRSLGLATAVVIIATQDTTENAMEAMRRGALDYLVKPFVVEEVQALAIKALHARELEREVRQLRRWASRRAAPNEPLVGKSPAMLEAFKVIGRVAPRDCPVLITGEGGTGKERVARAIHAASPRSELPFIAVNTAAIPCERLKAALFGHDRGAYSDLSARTGRFGEAAGGTLFLDEIGNLSSELQAELLGVLQDHQVTPVGSSLARTVDVRILTATHRNVYAAVRAARFCEELLECLRVVSIHLPPLRERPEDVRVLAEHFVSRYAMELAGAPRALADESVSLLSRHYWPGNVRELECAVKRALVLCCSVVLTPDDFAFLRKAAPPRNAATTPLLDDLVRREAENELDSETGLIPYHRMLERVERPLIEAALAHTNGNQVRAAALLGINRNTLRRKIADLAIALPESE